MYSYIAVGGNQLMTCILREDRLEFSFNLCRLERTLFYTIYTLFFVLTILRTIIRTYVVRNRFKALMWFSPYTENGIKCLLGLLPYVYLGPCYYEIAFNLV